MGIILRVDVDKPYGNHPLVRKIASKIVEDFLPNFKIKIGYLSHLKEFILYCNNNGVVGTFFHRICTNPDIETINLLKSGGHIIGLHLENSISELSFFDEINILKSLTGTNIDFFSKHGSGVFKLGKFHFPKYEPDLYKKWASNYKLFFPSGNGIPEKPSDLKAIDGYFENVFWLEPNYRNKKFNTLDELITLSKKEDVVVLIHPCNYLADPKTKEAFHELVELASINSIKWLSFEKN